MIKLQFENGAASIARISIEGVKVFGDEGCQCFESIRSVLGKKALLTARRLSQQTDDSC